MGFIVWLAIGAVAGWLAGKFMNGGGFGLVKNIIIGIIGAWIGGGLFSLIGVSSGGLIGSIIVATIGACIVLYVAELLVKKGMIKL